MLVRRLAVMACVHLDMQHAYTHSTHTHTPKQTQVIVLDMETGVACEAPQSLWDRVAASLSLSPDQALMFALLNRWWKTVTQVCVCVCRCGWVSCGRGCGCGCLLSLWVVLCRVCCDLDAGARVCTARQLLNQRTHIHTSTQTRTDVPA